MAGPASSARDENSRLQAAYISTVRFLFAASAADGRRVAQTSQEDGRFIMRRSTSTALTVTLLLTLLAPSSTAGIRAGAHHSRLRAQVLGDAGLKATAVVVRYVRGDSPEEADRLRERLHALSTLTASARSGESVSIARSYGPCILHPGIVYLRKEYAYKDVGMKPFTKCDKRVAAPTLIQHRTDLRYHWYNWWLQAGDTYVNSGRHEHNYLSKTIHYACDGTERTVWSGTTLGKVLWQGHTYYARVYQRARELKCGARWP